MAGLDVSAQRDRLRPPAPAPMVVRVPESRSGRASDGSSGHRADSQPAGSTSDPVQALVVQLDDEQGPTSPQPDEGREAMVFDFNELLMPEGAQLPPGWETPIEVTDWHGLLRVCTILRTFMRNNSTGPTVGAAVIARERDPYQEWQELANEVSERVGECEQLAQNQDRANRATQTGNYFAGGPNTQALFGDLSGAFTRCLGMAYHVEGVFNRATEEIMGWYMFEAPDGWVYQTPDEYDQFITEQLAAQATTVPPILRRHWEESRDAVLGQLELDAQIRQEFLADPFSIDALWQNVASGFSTALNPIGPDGILGHVQDISRHLDTLDAYVSQSASGIQPKLALLQRNHSFISAMQTCLNGLRQSARSFVEAQRGAASVGLDILRVTEMGCMAIAGMALTPHLVGLRGITTLRTAGLVSNMALTAYAGTMHAVGDFAIGGEAVTVSNVAEALGGVLLDTAVAGVTDLLSGFIADRLFASLGRLFGQATDLPLSGPIDDVVRNWRREQILGYIGSTIRGMGKAGVSTIVGNLIRGLGDPSSFTMEDVLDGLLERVVLGAIRGFASSRVSLDNPAVARLNMLSMLGWRNLR